MFINEKYKIRVINNKLLLINVKEASEILLFEGNTITIIRKILIGISKEQILKEDINSKKIIEQLIQKGVIHE